MTREKDTSQDDQGWEEPEDTRYHARPRPQPPRPRASQDSMRRRTRTPAGQPGSGDYRRAKRAASPRDVSEDILESPGRRPPMQRRPVPPRNDRYQETEPPIMRRRQTRNFREEEEMSYRRRPRQPLNSRDNTGESYTRVPMRREIDPQEDEYVDYDRPVRRSGMRVPPPPLPQRRTQPERRSAWSTMLIGCVGGIIMVALVAGIGAYFLLHALQVNLPGLGIGTSTFSQKSPSLPLPITSAITQLQVQNNVGNISITVDNAITTGGTLSYVKKTQASSNGNATAAFGHIAVKVQPGNSAACPKSSCLTISATVPPSGGNSVDMNIVLPAQNPAPQFILQSATQTGNISVENFNGLLTLTDDTGNVNVQGGLLDAGSCLQTRFGNVTFAGTLETTTAPAINPCAGNAITPPTAGSSQPWYSIKSGTGNVDVTLNSLSTKVELNATVFDKGQITSAYPITIQNSNGSPSYSGPLLPGTQPAAQLLLSTDTGNITLHKG
ncbi:MAG TPA: hypothetical protein VKR83_07435 [Ktedonobacteraceae bacterium]|nr:hypothetical protein [Ktedonobacteraceae bacterium]